MLHGSLLAWENDTMRLCGPSCPSPRPFYVPRLQRPTRKTWRFITRSPPISTTRISRSQHLLAAHRVPTWGPRSTGARKGVGPGCATREQRPPSLVSPPVPFRPARVLQADEDGDGDGVSPLVLRLTEHQHFDPVGFFATTFVTTTTCLFSRVSLPPLIRFATSLIPRYPDSKKAPAAPIRRYPDPVAWFWVDGLCRFLPIADIRRCHADRSPLCFDLSSPHGAELDKGLSPPVLEDVRFSSDSALSVQPWNTTVVQCTPAG